MKHSKQSNQPPKWYMPLRIFSFIVLFLMAAAVVYAGTISIIHWTGITV